MSSSFISGIVAAAVLAASLTAVPLVASDASASTLPALSTNMSAPADSSTALVDSSPVYRFWSPRLQVHFYTNNPQEKQVILSTYTPSTWTYEGIGFFGFASQADGTIPLYRFWSPRLGDHFYTTNAAERDFINTHYDTNTWRDEGIAYYVYPVDSAVTDTLTVARFWSPDLQNHFYTASAGERDSVRNNYPAHVWTYEGDNFRVPNVPIPVEPPVTGQPQDPIPPVIAPPVVTTPANPGDSKNCSDFANYGQAKAWFDTYFPKYGDIAKLDQDNDGIPCESLPGSPA